MPRRILIPLGCSVTISAFLLLLSCSDDVINNYYPPASAATARISGQLYPADSGLVVLEGDTTIEVNINWIGVFQAAGIPEGTYDIFVVPANHGRRIYRDVYISSERPFIQGYIIVSVLPWPFFYETPSGNSTISDFQTEIEIVSSEQLNLDDLKSLSYFEPEIAGEWIESGGSSNFVYQYLSTLDGSQIFTLPPTTTYTLHIDKSVRTVDGKTLDSDGALTFSTEDLELHLSGDLTNRGNVGILEPDLRIYFTTCVSEAAVREAVTFDPPIPGLWVATGCGEDLFDLPDPSYSFKYFMFESTLPAEKDYTLSVSKSIGLVAGSPVGGDSVFHITTESYGIIEIYPSDRGTIRGPRYAHVEFNAVMDTASVEASFSITDVDGEVLPGWPRWVNSNRGYLYYFDEPLISNSIYRIGLTTDAKTAEGMNLTREFESIFFTP